MDSLVDRITDLQDQVRKLEEENREMRDNVRRLRNSTNECLRRTRGAVALSFTEAEVQHLWKWYSAPRLDQVPLFFAEKLIQAVDKKPRRRSM